jgi:hypothetical protein
MFTRLLDWTTNPLAALWFTVEKDPKLAVDGVVWVFSPSANDVMSNEDQESTDPWNIRRTKVFRPTHIAPRIAAQAGWFTVHCRTRSDTWTPLEKNANYKQALSKLVIPGDGFDDMRRELTRCGVHEASMYGDLDGLCRQISRTTLHPPPSSKKLARSFLAKRSD